MKNTKFTVLTAALTTSLSLLSAQAVDFTPGSGFTFTAPAVENKPTQAPTAAPTQADTSFSYRTIKNPQNLTLPGWARPATKELTRINENLKSTSQTSVAGKPVAEWDLSKRVARGEAYYTAQLDGLASSNAQISVLKNKFFTLKTSAELTQKKNQLASKLASFEEKDSQLNQADTALAGTTTEAVNQSYATKKQALTDLKTSLDGIFPASEYLRISNLWGNYVPEATSGYRTISQLFYNAFFAFNEETMRGDFTQITNEAGRVQAQVTNDLAVVESRLTAPNTPNFTNKAKLAADIADIKARAGALTGQAGVSYQQAVSAYNTKRQLWQENFDYFSQLSDLYKGNKLTVNQRYQEKLDALNLAWYDKLVSLSPVPKRTRDYQTENFLAHTRTMLRAHDAPRYVQTANTAARHAQVARDPSLLFTDATKPANRSDLDWYRLRQLTSDLSIAQAREQAHNYVRAKLAVDTGSAAKPQGQVDRVLSEANIKFGRTLQYGSLSGLTGTYLASNPYRRAGSVVSGDKFFYADQEIWSNLFGENFGLGFGSQGSTLRRYPRLESETINLTDLPAAEHADGANYPNVAYRRERTGLGVLVAYTSTLDGLPAGSTVDYSEFLSEPEHNATLQQQLTNANKLKSAEGFTYESSTEPLKVTNAAAQDELIRRLKATHLPYSGLFFNGARNASIFLDVTALTSQPLRTRLGVSSATGLERQASQLKTYVDFAARIQQVVIPEVISLKPDGSLNSEKAGLAYASKDETVTKEDLAKELSYLRTLNAGQTKQFVDASIRNSLFAQNPTTENEIALNTALRFERAEGPGSLAATSRGALLKYQQERAKLAPTHTLVIQGTGHYDYVQHLKQANSSNYQPLKLEVTDYLGAEANNPDIAEDTIYVSGVLLAPKSYFDAVRRLEVAVRVDRKPAAGSFDSVKLESSLDSDDLLKNAQIKFDFNTVGCGVAADHCLAAPDTIVWTAPNSANGNAYWKNAYTGYATTDNPTVTYPDPFNIKAVYSAGNSLNGPKLFKNTVTRGNAAAVVSAAAARVQEQFPWMTTAQIKGTLLSTAYIPNEETRVSYYVGWGVLNAAGALRGPAEFLKDRSGNKTYIAKLDNTAKTYDRSPWLERLGKIKAAVNGTNETDFDKDTSTGYAEVYQAGNADTIFSSVSYKTTTTNFNAEANTASFDKKLELSNSLTTKNYFFSNVIKTDADFYVVNEPVEIADADKPAEKNRVGTNAMLWVLNIGNTLGTTVVDNAKLAITNPSGFAQSNGLASQKGQFDDYVYRQAEAELNRNNFNKRYDYASNVIVGNGGLLLVKNQKIPRLDLFDGQVVFQNTEIPTLKTHSFNSAVTLVYDHQSKQPALTGNELDLGRARFFIRLLNMTDLPESEIVWLPLIRYTGSLTKLAHQGDTGFGWRIVKPIATGIPVGYNALEAPDTRRGTDGSDDRGISFLVKHDQDNNYTDIVLGVQKATPSNSVASSRSLATANQGDDEVSLAGYGNLLAAYDEGVKEGLEVAADETANDLTATASTSTGSAVDPFNLSAVQGLFAQGKIYGLLANSLDSATKRERHELAYRSAATVYGNATTSLVAATNDAAANFSNAALAKFGRGNDTTAYVNYNYANTTWTQPNSMLSGEHNQHAISAGVHGQHRNLLWGLVAHYEKGNWSEVFDGTKFKGEFAQKANIANLDFNTGALTATAGYAGARHFFGASVTGAYHAANVQRTTVAQYDLTSQQTRYQAQANFVAGYQVVGTKDRGLVVSGNLAGTYLYQPAFSETVATDAPVTTQAFGLKADSKHVFNVNAGAQAVGTYLWQAADFKHGLTASVATDVQLTSNDYAVSGLALAKTQAGNDVAITGSQSFKPGLSGDAKVGYVVKYGKASLDVNVGVRKTNYNFSRTANVKFEYSF